MAKNSDITECPFCFAEIDPSARKCCYCGEWVDEKKGRPREHRAAGHDSGPQHSSESSKSAHEVVAERFDEAVRNDSIAFAVIALVCIFVWPPIGILLCLVGLFTGPRKGCFGTMLALFLLFPLILMVFGFMTANVFTGGVFFR